MQCNVLTIYYYAYVCSCTCCVANKVTLTLTLPSLLPACIPYFLPYFLLQVTMRRLHGLEPFNRTWAEYKSGFGKLLGEFWLGNEVVRQLTSRLSYTLHVQYNRVDGIQNRAIYETFTLGRERDGYRLHLGRRKHPFYGKL